MKGKILVFLVVNLVLVSIDKACRDDKPYFFISLQTKRNAK